MQKREFFNNGQLSLLASAAAVCAEPFDGEKTTSDEMAVYEMLAQYTQGYSAEQLTVIEFCAQECEHNHSGAISVYQMVNAWNHAMNCQHAGDTLNDELRHTLTEMVGPTGHTDSIIFNWLQGTLDAPQRNKETDVTSN